MDKIPPLVFHADWFDIIEDLPQEQQLEIYRAIMLYAFRGEKSSNPLVRATIALMVKFIDQDRVKYEKAIKQRKEAIRKRWEKHKKANTDEYDRINPNTTEYNTITNTITNTNTSQTKVVDVDNINSSHACAKSPFDESNLLKEFFAPERQATVEVLAMQLHYTIDEMKTLAQDIVSEWVQTGQKHNDYTDASRHLISTIRKRKQWGKDKAGTPASDIGIGEYRNSKGERTYGTSGIIVPESAPPRPSAAHWWSKTSERWEKMI